MTPISVRDAHFEPGERVKIYHRYFGSPPMATGRVVRLRTNKYGRVSYDVRTRGVTWTGVLLEELVPPHVKIKERQ